MVRKNNLALTFASGHEFFKDECFWVYIRSFFKNVFDSDLVIITHEMSEDVESTLLETGVFEVVRVPAAEASFLYRDRHLAYWKYLNSHGHKYKHVISTDSRDVVFQTNPFNWISEWKSRYDNIQGRHDFLEHFVILAAEGFKMSQSGFACIEHFEFERDVPRPYLKEDRNRSVLNGGTFLGSSRAMQDWHFLVWITSIKTIGRCTDQATVNWLMYYLDEDDTYQISHPQRDHLCLTGEGVKEGAVEPILKTDGKLYSPQGKLYCMIHQWDRLQYLREDVLAHYRE